MGWRWSPRTRRRRCARSREIYDRIAFAGVGRYNEFDQLRVAGVRAADLKGYQYSRDDVDARSLANQYAQILGQIFTHEMKPMEVEILVAEVGQTPDGDQMFHINYDGTVVDKRDYAVLGGDAGGDLDPRGRIVRRRSVRRARSRRCGHRRGEGARRPRQDDPGDRAGGRAARARRVADGASSGWPTRRSSASSAPTRTTG